MPNNITNQITFGSDRAALAAFQRMLHEVRAESEPLGSFDFNKLIPMPQELNIERGTRTDAGLKLCARFARESADIAKATMLAPEDVRSAAVTEHLTKWDAIKKKDPEVWALGEKAFQNIQKYGHPTWYEWCIDHWGTKWNAYQYAPLTGKSDTMVFFTSWSSVPKLIKALSRKYPNQEITYRWADEDLGHNVGEATFKGGEEIDRIIPADGSREAYEMSAKITGTDLSGCGLFLTPDQSTYEYREEPPQRSESKPKKKTKEKEQAR